MDAARSAFLMFLSPPRSTPSYPHDRQTAELSLSHCRPWLNVKAWREAGWKLTYYAGQPYGELYDPSADPHELVNLCDLPEHQEVRLRLQERLLRELVLTEPRLPPVEAHA
jgi:hypothetical protein